MRLLQLNQNGSEETALDFHPMVTVVNGLGASGREQLLRAVTALPAGRDPGCGGLLEAHGVMLDLTTDVLAMLDMHEDLDVLVRRIDLPAGQRNASVPATASAAAGVITRMSVEQFLRETPEGVHLDLDNARRRQGDAREALGYLVEAATKSKAGLDSARSRRQRLETELEDLRSRAAGADADVRLPNLMTDEELEQRRIEVEADLAALRGQLSRIDRSLEELSGIDTRPIEVLLDAIKNPVEVDWVPSERAAQLADEFVELQALTERLEAGLEARGLGTASALQRLERARAELQDAERGIAKPDLSPADVAELEAAHDEVLAAQAKASGRGARKGQRRLDEANAALQKVLDRVGFPTWSSYVMGAGLLAIDPVAEQRLERAHFEVEAAEAHWADMTAMIEADPEHGALLDRLETVYLEAYDLLGGDEPEDLEGALRTLKVPKREVTIEELVDALAYQLELVGLDFGDSAPGVDYAVMVAEAFLAESAGLNDRINELEADRAKILPVLGRAEYALERVADQEARLSGSTIDLTDEGLAEEALRVPGPEEIAAAERALVEAREDENDHAESLEAREALVGAATQVEAVATIRLMKTAGDIVEAASVVVEGGPLSEPAFDVSPGDEDGDAGPEAVEFYLLARLAALRNVSYAGSVPMVIDDALAGSDPEEVRSLLGKLERMAESVQVVYLGDDPTVVDWATEVGFTRAAVVTAPPAFG